ncbi:hypothetical protein [Aliikangiella marina]|nr:hypothetical protein [Aliikangiella marina]
MIYLKRVLILLTVAVAVTFSGEVLANCKNGQCTNVKITRMYVTPSGKTVIGTSGDESKLLCDAGSSGHISMEPEQKNYEATYSLILMAHTTDHNITIRTSESGSCYVKYVVSDK